MVTNKAIILQSLTLTIMVSFKKQIVLVYVTMILIINGNIRVQM